MKDTPQQEAFLEFVAKRKGNGALQARAGCGKTSTILRAVDVVREVNPKDEILVCAYNKAIADEISAKLVKRGHDDWRKVKATTMHSMGFGMLQRSFKPTIMEEKVANIVKKYVPAEMEGCYSTIRALVSHAKSSAFGYFPTLKVADEICWYALADHHDIEFPEGHEPSDIIQYAMRTYNYSAQLVNTVDFDDMILLPLLHNLQNKYFKDVLFVDEAQDLSPARQEIARKFLNPKYGRMFVIGDDRQAIYGFSGADAQSMMNMIESYKMTVFPLTVTWRCPKAVVELAKEIVPDFEAAPEAPEGQVLQMDELPEDLGEHDAILCRNTAPLIATAYKLIRANKPCKVEGRAIGSNLLKLATRWKVKTLEALRTKLETWLQREVAKYQAKNQDRKVEETQDKYDTVIQLIEICAERKQTRVEDLVSLINGLFADDVQGTVVLCTGHRSKGREWKRVFLLNQNEYFPPRYRLQPWQEVQEENLNYVMMTRAMETLVFLNLAKEKAKETQ